jgi:hypothetical protein
MRPNDTDFLRRHLNFMKHKSHCSYKNSTLLPTFKTILFFFYSNNNSSYKILNKYLYTYRSHLQVLGLKIYKNSRRGLGNFLLFTASRPALAPIQSPIQWVPGALSPEVKWPGREAEHSPFSSVEVKKCVALYLHPQRVLMAWCLFKHRDNFTFTFENKNLHLPFHSQQSKWSP